MLKLTHNTYNVRRPASRSDSAMQTSQSMLKNAVSQASHARTVHCALRHLCAICLLSYLSYDTQAHIHITQINLSTSQQRVLCLLACSC